MARPNNDKEIDLADTRIRENSWIAKMAAKKMRADNMAIVIGKTIHLYNTSRQHFLLNKKWLKHELCHIKQFQQYGFLPFIIKYLTEHVKNGYHNNKFEAEARKAENL